MRRHLSKRRVLASLICAERLETRQLLCSGALGIMVNAGGPVYMDAAQNSWDADAGSGFSGGTVSTAPFQVKGTAEQGLYNTRHVGSSFDFSAETDSGGYTLTLLFAEPVMTQPGMRVFDVFAQGKEILKNFDLVKAGGPQTAISKTFPVTVTNDELDLSFQGVVNNAIVSGIELTPLPIPPAAPTGLSATADSTTQVTLNWTDNANNETGFEIDRAVAGSGSWQNISSVGIDGETYTDTTASPGTHYEYRVYAEGQYGESPLNTTVGITTGGSAPVVANSLAAVAAVTGPAATDLRIDVGSNTTYLDSTKDLWMADNGASGGTIPTGSYAITGTADAKLYQTRRYGNFSYTLPADNGNYTLKLYFTETVMTAKKQRVFDVSAEGKNILTNFDIFATGGFQKPVIESFPVTVTGSQLKLTFKNVVNNAIVSAIELIPTDRQTAAPADPSALAATGGTNRVDLSWADNSSNESGFEIDRKGPGDAGFVRIATVPTNVHTFSDTGLAASTSYQYEVRAIDNFGDSDFTDAKSATTITPAKVTKITWTKLTGAAQSPVGRTEAETATVNGKLYCFGGYTDSTLVPEAVSDVFDPVAGTWTPLPNMPIGTTHAGTCTDGRYIYMAGGYTGPGGAGNQIFANTNVFKFDTETNTWSKIQPLPAARGAGSLVLLNGVLHFMGGTDIARKDQSTHWTLDLNVPNATWKLDTPLNQARNHLGGVALNGKIYVIAGQEHQDPNFTTVGTVEIFDPATDKWTTGAPLPVTRSHIAGATIVYNGEIIVMGGDHTYLHDVANVTEYDPVANKWTELNPLPIARSSGCGTVINGVFYYATGNIEKYVYKGVLS